MQKMRSNSEWHCLRYTAKEKSVSTGEQPVLAVLRQSLTVEEMNRQEASIDALDNLYRSSRVVASGSCFFLHPGRIYPHSACDCSGCVVDPVDQRAAASGVARQVARIFRPDRMPCRWRPASLFRRQGRPLYHNSQRFVVIRPPSPGLEVCIEDAIYWVQRVARN